MSLDEFERSQIYSNLSFNCAMMICMSKADGEVLKELNKLFPDIMGELVARRNSEKGILPTDAN